MHHHHPTSTAIDNGSSSSSSRLITWNTRGDVYDTWDDGDGYNNQQQQQQNGGRDMVPTHIVSGRQQQWSHDSCASYHTTAPYTSCGPRRHLSQGARERAGDGYHCKSTSSCAIMPHDHGHGHRHPHEFRSASLLPHDIAADNRTQAAQSMLHHQQQAMRQSIHELGGEHDEVLLRLQRAEREVAASAVREQQWQAERLGMQRNLDALRCDLESQGRELPRYGYQAAPEAEELARARQQCTVQLAKNRLLAREVGTLRFLHTPTSEGQLQLMNELHALRTETGRQGQLLDVLRDYDPAAYEALRLCLDRAWREEPDLGYFRDGEDGDVDNPLGTGEALDWRSFNPLVTRVSTTDASEADGSSGGMGYGGGGEGGDADGLPLNKHWLRIKKRITTEFDTEWKLVRQRQQGRAKQRNRRRHLDRSSRTGLHPPGHHGGGGGGSGGHRHGQGIDGGGSGGGNDCGVYQLLRTLSTPHTRDCLYCALDLGTATGAGAAAAQPCSQHLLLQALYSLLLRKVRDNLVIEPVQGGTQDDRLQWLRTLCRYFDIEFVDALQASRDLCLYLLAPEPQQRDLLRRYHQQHEQHGCQHSHVISADRLARDWQDDDARLMERAMDQRDTANRRHRLSYNAALRTAAAGGAPGYGSQGPGLSPSPGWEGGDGHRGGRRVVSRSRSGRVGMRVAVEPRAPSAPPYRYPATHE
jgi:hypothetical protein